MLTSRQTGLATVELVTTADRLPVQETRLSEQGVLVSLVAQHMVGTPEIGQLLVQAGIMVGQVGNPFKAAILIDEYAYIGHPVYWNGFIPLDPTFRLFIECRGAEAYTVRLSALVRRDVEG